MKNYLRISLIMCWVHAPVSLVYAAGPDLKEEETGSALPVRPGTQYSSNLSYGDKGLEFETEDGNTSLWFGVRLQTRYESLEGTPTSADDLRRAAA